MPGQTSILQKQLNEIRVQLNSAKSQLAELTPPDEDSAEVKDAVQTALKQAEAREQSRVKAEGLNNAVATLTAEQVEIQAELKGLQAEEDKKTTEELCLRGIEKIEELRQKFDDSVQALKDVIGEFERLEDRYGDHVRRHLANLKRDDRPDDLYFRHPHEKLIEIPEVPLPELKRVNGGGDAPIRWYGNLYELSCGDFFQELN